VSIGLAGCVNKLVPVNVFALLLIFGGITTVVVVIEAGCCIILMDEVLFDKLLFE